MTEEPSTRSLAAEPTRLADKGSNDDKGSHSNESVSIFLRLKPMDDSEKGTKSTITIEDENTVTCKSPNKEKKHGQLVSECARYTFTRIYNEDVDQAEFFVDCVYPQIKNVLVNERGLLLFTYGTTNAGKTFTLQGNAKNPGILPRLVDLVFELIKSRHDKSLEYKPENVDSVKRLDNFEMQAEMVAKQRIFGSIRKQIPLTNKGDEHSINDFPEMKEFVSLMAGNYVYSIWVSFFEIYNETIFDLLEEPNKITKSRTRLKLAYDERKNAYIKGLSQVCVNSPEEAHKVLTVGKRNLSFASTKLNKQSSRSHCTFTIRILKRENVRVPKFATVMSISLCDLAGTERQDKACNVGDRLLESQNINLSLHTLSRCFTLLRANLTSKTNNIVPFRDSKLTQIFQRALSGTQEERVMMIVNVNPSPNLYHETQQVLKNSAQATFLFKEQVPISTMKLNEIRNRKSSVETVVPKSVATADKKPIKGILKGKNNKVQGAPNANSRHVTLVENEDLYSNALHKKNKKGFRLAKRRRVWKAPDPSKRSSIARRDRSPSDMSLMECMLTTATLSYNRTERERRLGYIERCLNFMDGDTESRSDMLEYKVARLNEREEERLNDIRSELKKRIESEILELTTKDDLFLKCKERFESMGEFQKLKNLYNPTTYWERYAMEVNEKNKRLEKVLDEETVAFSETATNNERTLSKYESVVEKASEKAKHFKNLYSERFCRFSQIVDENGQIYSIPVTEKMIKELEKENRNMEIVKSKKMAQLKELKELEEKEQRILNRYYKARYNPSDKKPFLALHDERVAAAYKKLAESDTNKCDNGVLRDLMFVGSAHTKEQCV